MGKCILITHVAFFLVTLALTLAGVALVITVFATEKWLVADFKDVSEVHYHGLFKDCLESYREVVRNDARNGGPIRTREAYHTTCTFKEQRGHDDLDGEDHSGHSHSARLGGQVLVSQQNQAHVFSTWNQVMLVLLASAGTCGFLGLLVGLSAAVSFLSPGLCWGRCSHVLWFLLNGLASLLVTAALVYFSFKIFDPLIRTERLNSAVQREEQEKGISYTYAILAAVVFGVASIGGLVCTTLSCVVGQRQHSATGKVRAEPKINFISNTSV